ncbi:GSCFA domain-containing protein [Prevotella corporis]|uniref:GSCFA domain-containing protein n=1 Tax=Prevotella corporis TaxID=28128 RepID=UPI0023F7A0BA|nr:GSCFA domain-containing protein [Prevotella corporis]
MEFRTKVDIPKPNFKIRPGEHMLFVGSCFAANIGKRFVEEHFQATVNPFGVMYNPASVLHTVERMADPFQTVVMTLGTNHVYIEKTTGEIVDNCRKRPQYLFDESELSIEECAAYLDKAIQLLQAVNPDVHIILTVSPIRYAKYGYHESQLSKATLLMAANEVVRANSDNVVYFPAYEIVNDELRDYRFYKSDMLHPNEQAVEYIWERLVEGYFSADAKKFLEEWRPVKEAFAHRPFNPESQEYKGFIAKAEEKARQLEMRYHLS